MRAGGARRGRQAAFGSSISTASSWRCATISPPAPRGWRRPSCRTAPRRCASATPATCSGRIPRARRQASARDSAGRWRAARGRQRQGRRGNRSARARADARRRDPGIPGEPGPRGRARSGPGGASPRRARGRAPAHRPQGCRRARGRRHRRAPHPPVRHRPARRAGPRRAGARRRPATRSNGCARSMPRSPPTSGATSCTTLVKSGGSTTTPGIQFELFVAGAGAAVGAGGRYDDLVARFGRPLPAVGLALDLDAITEAVP